MPASAFALVLLGALIHAGWNIVAKKAGGDARFTFFRGISMARGRGPRLSLSPVAYVGELFAALIGGQLLGEGDRLLRILGAMAIAAGAMALAWG